MKIIDLFCGCGGMGRGFLNAGFEILFANDIDENCELTYKKNHPNILFKRCSIVDINFSEYDVDGIIGGPPCQGFSVAGNRDKNDERNSMINEFVKAINIISPKFFLMENVRGISSLGTYLKDAKTILSSDYNIVEGILNSADFCVPQNRKRLFLLGFRKDLNVVPLLPLKKKRIITAWEAISDLPQVKSGQGTEIQNYNLKSKNTYQKEMRLNSNILYNHVAMNHTSRLIERFKVIKWGQSLKHAPLIHSSVMRGNPKKLSKKIFSQNNYRIHPNLPAPTVAASFQSNFIHPYLNRNITAREGARLQSFPDDFIFMGKRTHMSWEKNLSQYQQIGNAVPVRMAEAIALKIKKQLKNNNK